MLSTSTRNANIENWAGQIDGAGLPWLYWEVLPNADPHVRDITITSILRQIAHHASRSTPTTMRLALWTIRLGALFNLQPRLLLRLRLPLTSLSTSCERITGIVLFQVVSGERRRSTHVLQSLYEGNTWLAT